jgi:hypothetical protein
MGKTCKTHRGDDKFIHNLSPKHVKERDHLKDLTVDGRVLNLKESRYENVNWIHLLQAESISRLL